MTSLIDVTPPVPAGSWVWNRSADPKVRVEGLTPEPKVNVVPDTMLLVIVRLVPPRVIGPFSARLLALAGLFCAKAPLVSVIGLARVRFAPTGTRTGGVALLKIT